ncbi:MAG: translocation/assembly module TamB [Bacteroidia bacterium]|nr:translocation/assembly module TamB [Bacteroidia bacterium]
MQTYIAEKVAQQLSTAMGVPVRIRSVNIRFLDRAQIEGVYLEDLHKDTLLYVEEMHVNLDDIFLGFTHFSFDEVKLKNGQFNVRQFAGEEDLNIQFLLDFINGPRDTTKKVRPKPPEIFFWKLDLDHVDFTYEYRDSIHDTVQGFDQNLIRIRDINASLKRFMIVNDSLSGELRNLQCNDPNGFVIRRMDTDFIISYTMMDFASLNLQTPLSSLNGKVHFDYDSYDDLSDFIPLVQMRGKIKESKIHTRDLAFFGPELIGLDQVLQLSGNFKGTVDDLSGKNVLLQTGNNTEYAGNFRMKGLPNTDSTYFRFSVRNFTTTANDLERIPEYPFSGGEKINLPDEVHRLQKISFNGQLEGLLTDFHLNGRLFCKPGELITNLFVKYKPQTQKYTYRGGLQSEQGLDIGLITKREDLFGRAAFNIEVEGEGLDPNTLNAKFSSEISSLSLNGYNYQFLTFDGTADGKRYKGRVKVADQHLKIEANLSANLGLKRPSLQMNASVGNADPAALGLWKTDSLMTVSAELIADLEGEHIDNLTGHLEISEALVKYGKGRYNIDDLLLELEGDQNNRDIEFYSNMFDAGIHGSIAVQDILPAFAKTLNQALPDWFAIAGDNTTKAAQEITAFVKLKDTRLLSALFVPSIQVNKGGELNLSYSSSRELIRFQAEIPQMHVAELGFDAFDFDVNTSGKKLTAILNTQTLQLTDSLKIKHIRSEIKADSGDADINLQWASRNILSKPDAQLNLRLAFQGKSARLEVLPSLILMGDSLWQVNEGNFVAIDTAAYTFENLSFSHLDEFIRIDGVIGNRPQDELDVVLDRFNISNINPLLLSAGINLQGKAFGIISLGGLKGEPYFKSNLKFQSISLNGDFFGDGLLASTWIPAEKRINLEGALTAANVPRMAFKGGIYPERDKNSLDLDISLNNLKVELFERYLKDIFSNIVDGYADGKIHLSGSPSEPQAEGSINLKRTALTVDLLNTTYSFTHEFILEKNQITAKNILVNDQFGNTALLDFKLNHRHFNDLNFDIKLQSKRIHALNTNETQSDLFYGTAFASGSFRAHGPIENIVMDITAKTEKGTEFYLPLFDAGEVSSQDFITFEKTGQTTNRIRKKANLINHTGYELNFNLNISNDADVILIFDPQTGDMIRGVGTADLHMEVTEAGAFNMFGDYTITSGDYQFNLVVSKPFTLQPGGTISFKGDPYDADINLTALYKVRTSLYNLVKNIDSSATVKRMIDVYAVMNLSDKLMKPTVKFDIQLPNADEATRNLLRSQIASDDELNRQVFALIMLGNFWPNQGGANEIAGLGGVNASELISGQLSNMLGALSDDVKLGVNYKQGDATNTEELRLMWSTQLLGDRVMIDGNFGTAGIPQSAVQNTSNLVGEFNIEAKLNPDGTIRIRVFNRSNQHLLVYNGVPYTQGIGLFYRRDFEALSELRKKKLR